MPTHRQQSFLGTLWLDDKPVNTLDTLLGKDAWTNWFGGAGVIPGLASTVRNDSHMLSCQASSGNEQAMLFYFRQTPAGYRLYVREPGKYFGCKVWVYKHLHVGVITTEEQASPFVMASQTGKPIALSDLEGDTHAIRLQHGAVALGRARRQRAPFEYLATKEDGAELWTLRISERNVPWLSQPYEI